VGLKLLPDFYPLEVIEFILNADATALHFYGALFLHPMILCPVHIKTDMKSTALFDVQW
jgi:hypothetical protein